MANPNEVKCQQLQTDKKGLREMSVPGNHRSTPQSEGYREPLLDSPQKSFKGWSPRCPTKPHLPVLTSLYRGPHTQAGKPVTCIKGRLWGQMSSGWDLWPEELAVAWVTDHCPDTEGAAHSPGGTSAGKSHAAPPVQTSGPGLPRSELALTAKGTEVTQPSHRQHLAYHSSYEMN